MAELDARRAEVLARAAKRIQRQIRTYLTRKEYIILRKATIHIQKLWRGNLFLSQKSMWAHELFIEIKIFTFQYWNYHRPNCNYIIRIQWPVSSPFSGNMCNNLFFMVITQHKLHASCMNTWDKKLLQSVYRNMHAHMQQESLTPNHGKQQL